MVHDGLGGYGEDHDEIGTVRINDVSRIMPVWYHMAEEDSEDEQGGIDWIEAEFNGGIDWIGSSPGKDAAQGVLVTPQ